MMQTFETERLIVKWKLFSLPKLGTFKPEMLHIYKEIFSTLSKARKGGKFSRKEGTRRKTPGLISRERLPAATLTDISYKAVNFVAYRKLETLGDLNVM